ncbi:serine/threonine protein phosphatase [Puniceicoccaceae bacterium K14]|nr:serine/threonine protein phosphatase [Puniceicoccaceae bacterium K14]
MHEIKDTQRAVVRIGYDGRVHKSYRGPFARERYENEVRVLRYLEEKKCDFVPRLLDNSDEELFIVTSSCGRIVESMSKDKAKSIFDNLESFGVKHGDAFTRNITYSPHLGKFCVIDFEFATILETGEGLTLEETKRTDYERPR